MTSHHVAWRHITSYYVDIPLSLDGFNPTLSTFSSLSIFTIDQLSGIFTPRFTGRLFLLFLLMWLFMRHFAKELQTWWLQSLWIFGRLFNTVLCLFRDCSYLINIVYQNQDVKYSRVKGNNVILKARISIDWSWDEIIMPEQRQKSIPLKKVKYRGIR